ncbi:unnamed protein product [Ostreobium quekettii]|uniref:Uncharacterized protein n=1 Tax=Ostreobium quekettii TaxID=121088 RepID=A0A8S1JCY3_9CHLO|nr:unnamed protein product [Ostreobium quekettii]
MLASRGAEAGNNAQSGRRGILAMVVRGVVYGSCIFAAAFSATVLATVAMTDAPWAEAVVAAAYGRPANRGDVTAAACRDAVGVGFALGACFGVGLLLCVDLLVYRVEGRWAGRAGGRDGGIWDGALILSRGSPLGGLLKSAARTPEDEGCGVLEAEGTWGRRDNDGGDGGGVGAGRHEEEVGRIMRRVDSGRLSGAENGDVKQRGVLAGWAIPGEVGSFPRGWRQEAELCLPSYSASLWEDSESMDEGRLGRPGRRDGFKGGGDFVGGAAEEGGGGRGGVYKSCSTSAATDITDAAITWEEFMGRGGAEEDGGSPWSDEGRVGKILSRNAGGRGGLAKLFDQCAEEGGGMRDQACGAQLPPLPPYRSSSDVAASLGACASFPRSKEWRSPLRRQAHSLDDLQEAMSESGRCCVPWLPPRPCGHDLQAGGERGPGELPPDLTKSLESIIIGSFDGSLDAADWSPHAPTECSRGDMPFCFRYRDSVTQRSDPEERWDASPDRLMMAAYLDGNQSDGGRSAPAGIHSFRSTPFSPSLLQRSDRQMGKAWGSSSLGSEYLVQKSNKTSHRTILDELELLAEMTREECVYRIECQRKALERMREDDLARKEAFESLKSGVAPSTKVVNRLRQRWGGKRRAKRRERLGLSEPSSWIDDVPLPLRNGCGVRAEPTTAMNLHLERMQGE